MAMHFATDYSRLVSKVDQNAFFTSGIEGGWNFLLPNTDSSTNTRVLKTSIKKMAYVKILSIPSHAREIAS